MKKILLLAAIAACMTLGANAQKTIYEGPGTGSSQVSWTTTQESNVLRTAATGNQQVYTRFSGSTKYVSLPNLLIDCVVTPADLKGYITRNGVAGTAVEALPAYAQVKNVFVTGQLTSNDSVCNGTAFNALTYIQDFAGDSLSTADQRAAYQVALDSLNADAYVSSYTQAADGSRVGQACNFTQSGAAEDFYQSNFSTPFTFTGKNNLRVSANLQNATDMEFSYNTVASSLAKPVVLRAQGAAYSASGAKTADVSPVVVPPSEFYNVNAADFAGVDVPMEMKAALPAFGVTYFTNDIKGTVTLKRDGIKQTTDYDPDSTYQPNGLPIVRLLDRTTHTYIIPDGKTALNSSHAAEINADGTFSFSALNPAHTYQLSVASNNYGYYEVNPLSFTEAETVNQTVNRDETFTQDYAGKANDVVVDITISIGTASTVDGVADAKQVSSVRYYNLQGQESATPYAGLNVAVTTYTDGTTSARKILK